jgi:hypothetical protein
MLTIEDEAHPGNYGRAAELPVVLTRARLDQVTPLYFLDTGGGTLPEAITQPHVSLTLPHQLDCCTILMLWAS